MVKNNKIKVLMVGNHPSVKGGITSVIGQLLDYDWQSDGIDISFIPTYIEKNNIINKIIYFIKAYIKIIKQFFFNKPDVVHIHMSYKGSFERKFIIHKLCKKFKVPDVIHLHGSEFKKWYNESNVIMQKKIRKLLCESDSFIVLGDKWNESIRNIEPTTKTVVVSNTIHIPKECVKWNCKNVQVLFLGVLIKRKGVADLLQAISYLKQNNKISNVKFVIAGSGDEENSLKEMCDRLQINSNVDFVGWTIGKKKDDLIKTSQLLVLPSYNEGLPVAILEAISYGLPIIATDVGDISSAVKDGINGYLIHPGEMLELAEAIERIVNSPELFNIMSKHSREIAEKEFSDKKYFEMIKQCYIDVVKK